MLSINQPAVVRFFVILLLLPALAGAVEVGADAPDFNLRSITGQEVALSSLSGQTVLLKIGTTWCPGCKDLGQEIDKVDGFLKERDVVLLDVFVQDTQTMVEKSQAGKTRAMTYHALVDDGDVKRAYGVYLIPRLLIIDAAQKVRFDSAGRELSAAEIETLVTECLEPLNG